MDENKRDEILNEENTNVEKGAEVAAEQEKPAEAAEKLQSADSSVKTEKAEDGGSKASAASVKKSEKKQPSSEKGKLSTWVKEIKAEYNKIIWPNKKELGKMTLTVIVTSLIFGVLITGLDVAFNFAVGLLVDLL